ncbi:hypothetical protein DENIS_3465 [Desulfonema ishimotonii]|uniref:Head decoration protein n=1 Tax=Desulfonema ishimotonii TaxID=45657 RepID=A0A401FZY1_9BACT|nr:hypothetical protein [Desulfonema ishimotonii]GBC62493.1 hypothetical protein DENIS_3465 [Desulfonema ishimotonii]
MTISGNLNTGEITVERARAAGHEPVVRSATLAGDDETWPAGLMLARGADGDQYPYDTEETVAAATGDGTAKTFSLSLGEDLTPGSVSVTDDTETFSDDGVGVLTGDAGGTGRADYRTGAATITFTAAPASEQAITATVKHRPTAVLDEAVDTSAQQAGLIIRHGTVKESMLVRGVAAPADATEAELRLLAAVGIWAV